MTNNTELFERKPVTQAVLTMVVPTIISQLITILYNMADTFFIGQTGDPNQVAAANVCMPLFIFLTGISNLFGIGGASLVSRCLGSGNNKKAKLASVFSVWGSVILGFIYGVIIYMNREMFLPIFGANKDTINYCYQYLFWTILIGSIPTVLNPVLGHLVRAEGNSKQASIIMTTGAVLNIVLDPIFILTFKLNIEGAAIATMISNLIATLIFMLYIFRNRNYTVISLDIRKFTLRKSISSEIILTGIPSALLSLTATFSNIMVNRLMSMYCNEAIAGVGIAKKIDLISFGVATGMSQGVVPLIGYNYTSKNYDRMKKVIKTTLCISCGVTTVVAILLFVFASPLVRAFINDDLTVQYGQYFQKLICIPGPFIAAVLLIITIFQSVGSKTKPLILSILRKGALDVPLMLILNVIYGVYGIIWATPIADFLAMVIAVLVFIPFYKSLMVEINNNSK